MSHPNSERSVAETTSHISVIEKKITSLLESLEYSYPVKVGNVKFTRSKNEEGKFQVKLKVRMAE